MLWINNLFLVMSIMACASFIHRYNGVGYGLISMTVFSFLQYDIERMTVVISIQQPMER
jgi:hypothetical protein